MNRMQEMECDGLCPEALEIIEAEESARRLRRREALKEAGTWILFLLGLLALVGLVTSGAEWLQLETVSRFVPIQ